MRSLFKKYLINTFAIYLSTQFIPPFKLTDNNYQLLTASLILSILLYFIKPIINLIMLPINIITLNFTSWIINIMIVYLWIILTPGIEVNSWNFSGGNLGPIILSPMTFLRWQVIIILGIILTLIIRLFNWLLK